MLRIHFLQHWFNLSDPAAEESLYDINSMRHFAGIDLGHAPVPDETTICKFRHLLERHKLGKKLFEEVNAHLRESGVKISGGTIVDATIIAAPSSTKNQMKERDPEMRQTKKGNQWHFGMKAHVGVDSANKIVHTLVTTAANVHDSAVLSDLLHGGETRVWGDSAYTAKGSLMREKAPRARDFTNKRAYRNRPLSEADRETNRRKSSIRSRVEHVFGNIKSIFGFRKVRYRGLAKNTNRLHVLCALSNLLTQKNRLLRLRPA
jgi:IS5 family transposase